MTAISLLCLLFVGPELQLPGKQDKLRALKEQSQMVADAIAKDQHEKLVDLTHPSVVEKAGGRKAFIAGLELNAKNLRAKGTTVAVKLKEPKDIAENMGEWYGIVPYTIEYKGKDARSTNESYMIGVSADGGNNWKFVMAGNRSLEQIKQLLPNLPKKLSLPPTPLLAGAKLLHKLPFESDNSLGGPIFLETTSGPRLAVWVRKENPAKKDDQKNKFGLPFKQTGFDLIVWDVKAGKELYRLGKEESAPPFPSALGIEAGAPFGTLHSTPDGKKLVSALDLGKSGSSEIKSYDPEMREWQTVFAHDPKGTWIGPGSIVFAADGSMIILNHAQCIVLETGKSQPCQTFRVDRKWDGPAALTFANPLIRVFDDAVLARDDKTLAVAVDKMVNAYDINTGKRIFQAPAVYPANTTIIPPVTASLAFSDSSVEPKLLVIETVPDIKKNKWLAVARVLDINTKKEITRTTLSESGSVRKSPKGDLGWLPAWGWAYPYFNAKGEPRVLLGRKLFDVVTGKIIQQTDIPYHYIASRDGKYVVRLTAGSDLNKRGVEVWSVDMNR